MSCGVITAFGANTQKTTVKTSAVVDVELFSGNQFCFLSKSANLDEFFAQDILDSKRFFALFLSIPNG
jgi:hypothetical protein